MPTLRFGKVWQVIVELHTNDIQANFLVLVSYPPPLGWYCSYLLVGIAVLSMVGILVGITVQAIFYLGYFLIPHSQSSRLTHSQGGHNSPFSSLNSGAPTKFNLV
jgi:hypothetical protein